ncbi:hypothetical protein PNEG_00740 [Pneumocystis murina B123]|uniref:C3H1-type domain-containing protein n=1 Tax=Pneumocystis murina (strain B123) TaxID=1069680 RepID=M7PKZ9_PNEMU|nr:hypothetical protein PNEG_00740 [Pneumocystis murina B123]EMR11144.1 hypothetical protein PNEG_00740 [Pneumocystis murina B123]
MPQKKTAPSVKKNPQKIVEDKTFGLKNKNKSSKIQAHIRQIESQAANIGKNKITKEKEMQKKEQTEKKIAEESRKMELSELFKQPPQKVPFGVDPKSILCQYFKQGFCDKGKKCKFSHNLDVEKRSEKKDIYTDSRLIHLNENKSLIDKKNDTIDLWDDEKLQSVVLSKHGNPKTTTNIVCKFFLEAIEKGIYGWFWVCPNDGDNCKYKHRFIILIFFLRLKYIIAFHLDLFSKISKKIKKKT